MVAMINGASKHCWHCWNVGDIHPMSYYTAKDIQKLVGKFRERHPEYSSWRWSCRTVGSRLIVTRVK
jgi:hypothetical protein